MSADYSQNNGPALIAFAWAFFSVSFIIVALRVWTRLGYLHDRLQLHDWLMVAAIITEIFHSAFLTLAQQSGLGRHIEVLTGTQDSITGHYVLALQSLSITVSYFGRMSFAGFLLTIVGAANNKARYALWFFIITDTLINVVCMMETNLQCGAHISANWNPAVAATTTCVATDITTAIGYTQASWNSLTDLALTIIPFTVVWNLNLPRSTKAALLGLLTMSAFAFLASVAKAVEIRELSGGDDFTFNFANLQFCVIVENNVVMIAASLPMLRALWIKNNSPGVTTVSGPKSGAVKSKLASKKGTQPASVADAEDDAEDMFGDKKSGGGIQRTMATVVESTWAEGKEPQYRVEEV